MSEQKAEFTIIYDGEGLKESTIDVKDLAPALLSVGSVFQEANRVLNGKDVEIKIYVKATGAGCFQIDFSTVQNIFSQAQGFLTGDFVTSALNLKELIFGVLAIGGGLFWLINKIKGENPDKIEDIGNGVCRITIGNEVVDIPLSILKLYQDLAVRKAAEGIVAPLKQQGIETLKIKDNTNEYNLADKTNVEYFNLENSVIDETVLENEREQAFSIISLSFKEENKWRLFDGNSSISVKILDEDFLNKVNAGVSFAKGDVLVCRVRSIQKNTAEGLKNEYEILKVVEHKHQARLFNIP